MSRLLLGLCCLLACGVQGAEKGAVHALLVGVNKYTNGMRSLNYAENDVYDFGRLLLDGGADRADIVVLTPGRTLANPQFFPTRQNILKQLDLLIGRIEEDDSLIVGLAGHGVRFEKKVAGKAEPVPVNYFVPPDGSLRDVTTLLDLDEIYDRLKKCPARFKLLLCDACRNDAFLEDSPRPGTIKLPSPSPPPGGVGALFSCQDKEFAWEDGKLGTGHGVFFYFVIEGLKGAADYDQDGKIVPEELSLYTKKQVARHVATKVGEPQTPRLLGDLTGAVPIARVLVPIPTPPKPAPTPTPSPPNSFAGSRAGAEWEGNGLKMKFCWCPAGSFTMGSPKSESGHSDDEDQVSVTLTKGFWLGKYEVTQGEWKSLMGTTVAQQKAKTSFSSMAGEGNSHPMYYVSHAEATEYCVKLTEQERGAGRLPTGWEFRLPTEAQWEYACRAGSKEAFGFGNNESELGAYAWYGSNSDSDTHPVGTKKANAWNLHDMHGNVWEWCRDWYDLKLPGGTDPERTQQASLRVFRGGSWFFTPLNCRSAYRFYYSPDARGGDLGFRVAAVQSGR